MHLVSEEQTENRSRKIRKETDLVESLRSDETVRLPCGGRDETYPECLRFGDGHEPLIRTGGVYFVKAQTVNACVRTNGCTEKTREYNLMGDQKNREYNLMGDQKTREKEVKGAQKKIDAYKLMDSQKVISTS